jgi:hypothetical protein
MPTINRNCCDYHTVLEVRDGGHGGGRRHSEIKKEVTDLVIMVTARLPRSVHTLCQTRHMEKMLLPVDQKQE